MWRRRRCLQCGKAFTTEERFDPTGVWEVKDGTKKSPYSRAHLSLSLLQACDHRQNLQPTAWYLFEAIEEQLFPIAAQNNHIIDKQEIILQAAAILKNFDAAGYIKYLSYHQPAMDARSLRKHLRKG